MQTQGQFYPIADYKTDNGDYKKNGKNHKCHILMNPNTRKNEKYIFVPKNESGVLDGGFTSSNKTRDQKELAFDGAGSSSAVLNSAFETSAANVKGVDKAGDTLAKVAKAKEEEEDEDEEEVPDGRSVRSTQSILKRKADDSGTVADSMEVDNQSVGSDEDDEYAKEQARLDNMRHATESPQAKPKEKAAAKKLKGSPAKPEIEKDPPGSGSNVGAVVVSLILYRLMRVSVNIYNTIDSIQATVQII